MVKILVVEDNKDLLELFCTVLEKQSFTCYPALSGVEALEIIEKEHIELMISDIMMPNMDGYELVKSLRHANYNFPILLVTAKNQFEDIEQGFITGADDYMTKPINVNELVLRVNALLRRAKIASENSITVGDTTLNRESFTVTVKNNEILLPQKEFLLLFTMLSYPNKIFTRQQLMDEIWGIFSETDERTINTHINRVRDRFSDSKDFKIITIRGLGYKVVKCHES